MTGRPLFRKYAADGTLAFERHIEGVELDALLDAQPTRGRGGGSRTARCRLSRP